MTHSIGLWYVWDNPTIVVRMGGRSNQILKYVQSVSPKKIVVVSKKVARKWKKNAWQRLRKKLILNTAKHAVKDVLAFLKSKKKKLILAYKT